MIGQMIIINSGGITTKISFGYSFEWDYYSGSAHKSLWGVTTIYSMIGVLRINRGACL